MKKHLKKLPKEVQDLIYEASRIASSNNMPVYLVGGFVRDLLLGVKNLDLDIVVEGNGIKFAEDFAHILKARLIRHRRFGTATILLRSHLNPVRDYYIISKKKCDVSNGVKIDPSTSLRVNGERSRTIDIASARKELYPEPAHLPLVAEGNLKDDLFRRDFTINAMAISIGCKDFGKLIDYFGGKCDLDTKKIRVLHNLSFIDDPTRILRAIRFEKRYNFKIESKTLKDLKEAVKLKMLERVEPQRIRDDLILMLKERCPLKEIRRLQGLTGLVFISPQVRVLEKTYRLLRSIERQLNWFKKVYPLRRHLDAWLIYFMGITETLAINELKDICRRFAFNRGEEKRILTYKKIKRRVILKLNREEIKPSEVFELLEPLSYEILLLIKARYKSPRIQRHIEDFFKDYNGMRISISGKDLRRLGLEPGPHYQKIFKKVLNAKLDGFVKTKEEELALISNLMEPTRAKASGSLGGILSGHCSSVPLRVRFSGRECIKKK